MTQDCQGNNLVQLGDFVLLMKEGLGVNWVLKFLVHRLIPNIHDGGVRLPPRGDCWYYLLLGLARFTRFAGSVILRAVFLIKNHTTFNVRHIQLK